MTIGVLALQGGFSAHLRTLGRLGVAAREVRRPHELEGLRGLVLPGGESTTLLKLMDREPAWWQVLPPFVERRAVLATCAGVILLARAVTEPAQRSLGLLDVDVARNAYGRQLASCEVAGRFGDGRPLEMIFIRAPRILRVGLGVEILAEHRGDPVLVRQGDLLAATFHPELTDGDAVHRLFLDRAASARAASTPAFVATAG